MTVSILGQLENFTSHGRHLCELVSRLPALGVECVVRPTKLVNCMEAPIPEQVLRRVKRGPNDCNIELIIGPPKFSPTEGKRTIYLAAYESTQLPRESVEILNRCIAVVVPSNFCAQTFSASGVTVPIIVVPLGVSDEWSYRTFPKGETTIFACSGNLQNGAKRKGVQTVIDLFCKAFQDNENVRLNVKVHGGDRVDSHGDHRINVASQFWPDAQMRDWLASAHCLVHFGIGAFELQVLEAMTLGRPAMAMKWGGHADYFSSEIGLEVAHHLVPADDVWAGHGLFAEPDEDSALAAFRWAYHSRDYVERLGMDARNSVRHLTWASHAKQIAEIIEGRTLKQNEPVIEIIRSADPLDDVTVCVTAFNRPKYLKRAVDSAKAAGFKVVVAEMTPENDLGCNELWLRAAYLAKTPRVIILHDDDVLLPELRQRYRDVISPAMDDGYAVTWRGAHLWNDGTVTPTEYWHGSTRKLNVSEIEQFLLTRGRLSLSPIVTVFARETLIHALKEADKYLTHYLHPGMPLGTEVIAHLRQQQGKKGWLYIDQVLSHYGVHDGSGTYAAEKKGDLSVLVAGYDQARSHFEQHRNTKFDYAPKILFLYSVFAPRDISEHRRMDAARWTWKHHFDLGNMVAIPFESNGLPKLHGIIDHGWSRAAPEDVIVYANCDLALTAHADREILDGVKKGDGVCVAWRRSMPAPDRRMIPTSKGGKIDGGVDLVAVTPDWWFLYRNQIPNMFIGASHWDWCFRIFAERVSKGRCYVSDGTYHEPHESLHSRLGYSTLEQVHNAKIAKDFFTSVVCDPRAAASIKI